MDHQDHLLAEIERLQAERTSWRREALSARAAFAWTERALNLHGPDAALETLRRARTTSDRHRCHRQSRG